MMKAEEVGQSESEMLHVPPKQEAKSLLLSPVYYAYVNLQSSLFLGLRQCHLSIC